MLSRSADKSISAVRCLFQKHRAQWHMSCLYWAFGCDRVCHELVWAQTWGSSLALATKEPGLICCRCIIRRALSLSISLYLFISGCTHLYLCADVYAVRLRTGPIWPHFKRYELTKASATNWTTMISAFFDRGFRHPRSFNYHLVFWLWRLLWAMPWCCANEGAPRNSQKWPFFKMCCLNLLWNHNKIVLQRIAWWTFRPRRIIFTPPESPIRRRHPPGPSPSWKHPPPPSWDSQ